MGLDWLAEKMAVSAFMFVIVWVVGCFWRVLKSNQRLALGDAFEASPRFTYFKLGSAVECSPLIRAERAV